MKGSSHAAQAPRGCEQLRKPGLGILTEPEAMGYTLGSPNVPPGALESPKSPESGHAGR